MHPDNSNSSIFVDFCERVIKCKEKTIETLIKSRAVPSKNVPHFMKQNKKSHVQSVSVARNACDELLKKRTQNKQKRKPLGAHSYNLIALKKNKQEEPPWKTINPQPDKRHGPMLIFILSFANIQPKNGKPSKHSTSISPKQSLLTHYSLYLLIGKDI